MNNFPTKGENEAHEPNIHCVRNALLRKKKKKKKEKPRKNK